MLSLLSLHSVLPSFSFQPHHQLPLKLQETSSALSVCEEMRTARDSVVCPQPRRFGLRNATFHDPVRSLRWHLGHQGELCDSKAASDALDSILTKGVEPFSFTEIGSPHPFFNGSPPGRVANPLIRDDRFGSETLTPVSPLSPVSSSSPSSSTRSGGGFVRAIFGSKPTVRVEGFDCLDRDSRNCRIPSLA
uniref:uncharacterized protein LOC101315339 isoform X2 n=1 Tax=Fragaria vesca subsp. vesca TaxID=101020 RepID=UPI0005CAF01B|nr:PREDICTED: uncharacterized protein LOC101315339 isoform X2 [Fragaria vesca subsp. vesca]